MQQSERRQGSMRRECSQARKPLAHPGGLDFKCKGIIGPITGSQMHLVRGPRDSEPWPPALALLPANTGILHRPGLSPSVPPAAQTT